MALTTSLSGFPELLPAGRVVEDHVVAVISRIFELHGFTHLQTRAVEPVSELTSKGETSKEIYLLSRLQDATQEAKLGLHFDLTVPFARFVRENQDKLAFPFRRYQIQQVWRGERPQEGRFREFVQADIDIVAQDELPSHFETEIALVMAQALAALPIPPVSIHVNSRKILQGACSALGIDAVEEALRILDKRDKLPLSALQGMLGGLGISGQDAQKLLELGAISGKDNLREQVSALGLHDDLLSQGLDDVQALLAAAHKAGAESIMADFKIARGLDYYTGMVYETFLEGYESVGSICSGGRYDTLVADRRHSYPGVGMSIGVSRLVSQMLSVPLVEVTRTTPSAVLVALPSEDDRDEAARIAQTLRRRGIATEVSPTAAKFGKQIRYAQRRSIPYVWFPDTGEVKDIRSGQQVPACPEDWELDPAELSPQVVAVHG